MLVPLLPPSKMKIWIFLGGNEARAGLWDVHVLNVGVEVGGKEEERGMFFIF